MISAVTSPGETLKTLQNHRRLASRLVERARYLTDRDRTLIEAIYDRGLSATDVARLADDCPRATQKRLATLIKHLHSPLFVAVLSRLETMPRDLQPVARLKILGRRSQRKTARLMGCSDHNVRKRLLLIEGLVSDGR